MDTAQVIPERLERALAMPLAGGGHRSIEHGMCVMEAVSYVAGEPWSDTPACACPVIASFLRSWNDSLPDADRTRLLAPLIARIVGTKSTPEIERRRSLMAADWLVRVNMPAWLRLAGLAAQADALASLPEITAMAQVPSIRPAIEAARRDAAAAWEAAGAAAGAAAWAAAVEAAGAAAVEAAWEAAGEALKPTITELQAGALVLVERMIEAAP